MQHVRACVQGVELSVRRRDFNADDGAQDPFFFDQDYSVAAATGQLMWEGSWALVQLLQDQESWLAKRLANGTRTLELGAGIGLLGLSAAAAGAHVLLTDLPSIVEASLELNLRANAPDGRVGAGSVSAAPLDWRRPLHEQHAAAEFAETAQVVLAAECVCMSSERYARQRNIQPLTCTPFLRRAPRARTAFRRARLPVAPPSQV